jgi:hypothetical protein
MSRVEGLITVENAKIKYPNFSGNEDRFNKKGDRNFNLVLPEDIAQQMEADGYIIKRREQNTDEGIVPSEPYVKCKLGYKFKAPRIYLVTSRNKTLLTEDLVGSLDDCEILMVDVILSPYNWEIRGETGVTPYVNTMYVLIHENLLDRKWADLELNVG